MDLGLERKKASLKVTSISDKIEATFGPNPCTQLHLQTEDGDNLYLTCDNKRCVHCGPRKKLTIQLQAEQTFGDHAYITTFDNRQELDRALETARKAASRRSEEFIFQSVGDATLTYIVASNRPLLDGQRMSMLGDWMRRILDYYHRSVQRIRRSYALGRVSLVTLRRKGKSGQASPWSRITQRNELYDDAPWRESLNERERYGVWMKRRAIEYAQIMTRVLRDEERMAEYRTSH